MVPMSSRHSKLRLRHKVRLLPHGHRSVRHPQLAARLVLSLGASPLLPSIPATPPETQSSLVARKAASGVPLTPAQRGPLLAIKTPLSRWAPSLLLPRNLQPSTQAPASKLPSALTFIMALAF